MILQKSCDFLSAAAGVVALLTGLIYTQAPSLENFQMKHLNVLAMVVNLLIGVWAIFYFQQKSRRFHDAGLRPFLAFLVLFNLLELESFFLIYFHSNLTPAQWGTILPTIKGIDWPLSMVLLLGLSVCQFKLIAWQRQKKLSRRFLPALFSFAAGLTAFFLLAMRVPALMPENPYLNFWNLYIWPLNALKVSWLVCLLAESRGRPDRMQRRSSRAFAWLFLGQIMGQAALLLLSMARLDDWNIVLAKLLILYTVLLPVVWLKFFYIPWAGALSRISNAGSRLDSLHQTHGLSQRELEILRLVLDGKSYKQMEATLFISIHTVKSHVYNLYRKLGVKSHRQLTHFIATRQQENS
jgi:DNA-binding CsgD family transcriptional regulator